ncbi:MAG: rhodanese-like domain-containing protein [Chitinophagaceae bacterium]
MGILSFLGFGRSGIKEALKKGAVIIDVRTANEFDNGKIPGSINIPVDRLSVNIQRLRQMNRPVIFCCSSGARSSKAAGIARQNGIKDVYNGGNWMKVLALAGKS